MADTLNNTKTIHLHLELVIPADIDDMTALIAVKALINKTLFDLYGETTGVEKITQDTSGN